MFAVRAAAVAGANSGRMRRGDLERPFSGIRRRRGSSPAPPDDAFARQAAERRAKAAAYAPRLREGQFFSHETAAALWGAPLPLERDGFGRPLDGGSLPVHVSTLGSGPLVRAAGVTAHRADPKTSHVVDRAGIAVASAATTWASLGALPLTDLVALGDFLCRCWRPGVGRRHAGRPPIATPEQLRAAIAAGRRVGAPRLREAVELIRTDSWSPRESQVRCILVRADLPEPELNVDIHDADGRFLGCVDLVYPTKRVIIEYHGQLHSDQYAADVERIAALRAAGWTVIEVTAELLRHPRELVRRVRAALAA